jgi:hypothetical protein
MTHVSLPCINTGRITVLYNRILVNRWICLDQEYTQAWLKSDTEVGI